MQSQFNGERVIFSKIGVGTIGHLCVKKKTSYLNCKIYANHKRIIDLNVKSENMKVPEENIKHYYLALDKIFLNFYIKSMIHKRKIM